MASVSVSHLILFIASIVIAASVAGVFTNEVGRLSEAIGDQGVDVSEDIRTDIEIISDAGSPVYDGTNITLLVKNTGTRALTADARFVDVLVDGEFQTAVTVSVLDASSWGIGDVAEIEVQPDPLSSGDHRVVVVVDGDEEVFEFRT